ncbi:MAG: hypothetical protein A2Y12_17490 [Planctomycetes bacterium GWF2_42_9]|nr:MAG: hypothetical protein A2Y12_17490 [Planctomycetes bacterium GWF2_42_9]HAL45012.1 hypothetical protein [Phycisphaerales bacterium]
MDKKIKIILASLIFSSVLVFLVFLYIASVVMNKIPSKIALILGFAVTISDSLAALYIISRPTTPKK